MSTIFFKILKGGKILQERYETFTVLINRISRNIKKIKNKEMAEYDLRSPHISCLYYIYLEKNITATMLCEKCEEDKATISRALDYLEEKGYIFREFQGTKRYNSPLLLTEKGEKTGEKIAEKIENVLKKINEDLSEDMRKEFYTSLALISEKLEKEANREKE